MHAWNETRRTASPAGPVIVETCAHCELDPHRRADDTTAREEAPPCGWEALVTLTR